MESTGHFMYAWEYRVRPEAEAEFRRVYGPDGAWVRLFRRATGHVETRLYRDRASRDRFVTIDHWESEAAFRTFRERFAVEFEALDAACEELTSAETRLGEFEETGM
jgi:heme-degrading monooxygenase HmoA